MWTALYHMYHHPHRYQQYVEDAYVKYLKEKNKPDEVG